MSNLGLIHDASELRKLIAENPDLPIVFLAGEEANCGGNWYWMYCSSVRVKIIELLDIQTPYDDESVFTDRDEFEDRVYDSLYTEETRNMSDDAYEAMVNAEITQYNPYWRKAIAVYVDN